MPIYEKGPKKSQHVILKHFAEWQHRTLCTVRARLRLRSGSAELWPGAALSSALTRSRYVIPTEAADRLRKPAVGSRAPRAAPPCSVRGIPGLARPPPPGGPFLLYHHQQQQMRLLLGGFQAHDDQVRKTQATRSRDTSGAPMDLIRRAMFASQLLSRVKKARGQQ